MEAVVSRPGFWRDRRTFVTGGTGLVGGWLVKRLLDLGADVVCLVRDWVPTSELLAAERARGAHAQGAHGAQRAHRARASARDIVPLDRVTIVRGDVRRQATLERILGEYEIDTVIHLAAQTIVGIANRNPVSTFDTNVRGTWALLEACRRSPAVRQVVVASSDKAYGECTALPYDESTPLRGAHPYDVSKSCADLVAHTYANTYGLPVAITRCGNFYGGGDLNWNRIVPGTIRSVLRGERPIIRSDGQFVRDYFYVEDGAAAYTLLAERLAEDRSLAGQAFNFSNEIQLTVTDLTKRILALMGSALEPEIQNRATHEIRHQYLSAEKARTLLHWRPLFTLDQGLERTVAWYRAFLGTAA